MTPSNLHKRIRNLANDLWWTWNADAQRLFAAVDPVQWRATRHTPLLMLARTDPNRFAGLYEEAAFVRLLQSVEKQREKYYQTRPWMQKQKAAKYAKLKIAYFSSEFAFHESMPQYAGGLGVLAGDHLKSASDLGIPLVGIGLLYGHGYYQQELRGDGTTRVIYPDFPLQYWPLTDTEVRLVCPIGNTQVHAKVWKLQVGRIPLYLLDSNLPQNKLADRRLTEGLYKGNPLNRLRQQVLLGVGGRLALHELNYAANVFHLNEGHAAFCNLQRLAEAIAEGRSFDEAMDRVAAGTVFTTHTPVPAGHDRYAGELIRKTLSPLRRDLGLKHEVLMGLGRERKNAKEESFCMTVLALKTASHCNGVAKLHGATSRAMWQNLYQVDTPEDVPIRSVTNGIHIQTWLAPEAGSLYRKYLRPQWSGAPPLRNWWDKVDQIPDAELWQLRLQLRTRLIHFVREKLRDQAFRHIADFHEHAKILDRLDPDCLTLGFARRFATYKRAPLVFHDPKRLAAILNRSDQPVQIIFAGKAHPDDKEGQAYAQKIVRFSQRPEFCGRIAVLEDYDMDIGRQLVAGCDVWLNTPLRPYEASGTSGMKPPLHGGIHFSIADGWWPEGFDGKNGWVIGDGQEHVDRKRQDREDARSLYRILEQQIVPKFYKRNRAGIPKAWLKVAKASMRTLPAAFSSHRMLHDYLRNFYLPACSSE